MGVFMAVWERGDAGLLSEQVERALPLLLAVTPDFDTWREGGATVVRSRFSNCPENESGDMQGRGTPHLICASEARLDNRAVLLSVLTESGLTSASSDNALICAAYARWGEQALLHLAGEFAFVIWDRRARRLVAARDPIGIRQLFYAANAERLTVASTLLAALEGAPNRRADRDWIHEFLTDTHSTRSSRTAFEGVRRLQPGHMVIADAGRIRVVSVRQLGDRAEESYQRDEDYADRCRELLQRAVKARLRSRGAVAVHLSGGVDSASVASLAHEAVSASPGSPPLQFHSMRFSSVPTADERLFQAAVVSYCPGVRHSVVECDDCWSLSEFHSKQPFPMPEPDTLYNRAMSLRLFGLSVANGCHVALDGSYADQVLIAWAYASPAMWRALPFSRRLTEARWFLPRLWQRVTVSGLARRAHTLGEGRAVANRTGIRSPAPGIVRAEIQNHLVGGRQDRKFSSIDHLQKLGGIELRHPFLDLALVEFLLGVPPRCFFRGGVRKALLRQAMIGCIPEVIRRRSHVTHITDLMLSGPARAAPMVHRWLAESLAVQSGFLTREAASQLFEGVRDRPTPSAFRDFYRWLALESWLRYGCAV